MSNGGGGDDRVKVKGRLMTVDDPRAVAAAKAKAKAAAAAKAKAKAAAKAKAKAAAKAKAKAAAAAKAKAASKKGKEAEQAKQIAEHGRTYSEWWDRTTAKEKGKSLLEGGALEGLTKYEDEEYLNYVLANPDLRELAEGLGLTQSEMVKMGQQHWGVFGTDKGGKGETRAWTPETAGDADSFSSIFSAGDDAASEAYIQKIVRNAIGSQMWDSRSDIDKAWNIDQFTGSGWNMAADQPYRTGILDNTLTVNTDIGQLVPTPEGDLKFLQDRYVDANIANDFPVGWTTKDNTWAGPKDLGAFWDVLTNAFRDDEGILRRLEDYKKETAVGESVSPGPRGFGNVRLDDYVLDDGGKNTIGLQDWTRFGTNPAAPPPLQEGGLKHYQIYAGAPTGTGVNLIDSSSNNIWGDSLGTGSILSNLAVDGKESKTSSTMTDAQGKKWVMSNGNWYPVGSDYAKALSGNARLYPFDQYDSGGMYMGAEGADPETEREWDGGLDPDIEGPQ